eukprot:COSAG01_NODE_1090_length_11748_cov_58.142244_5_plen_120_part_00
MRKTGRGPAPRRSKTNVVVDLLKEMPTLSDDEAVAELRDFMVASFRTMQQILLEIFSNDGAIEPAADWTHECVLLTSEVVVASQLWRPHHSMSVTIALSDSDHAIGRRWGSGPDRRGIG